MSRDFAPLLSRTPAWWEDHGEIARLLRWLHHDQGVFEARALIAVVEAPWHWDKEYSDMCREQANAGIARDDDALARSEDP